MTTQLDKDLDRVGRAGTAAWNQLKKSKDWGHWMIVGEALAAGRAMAMRTAGTNRPEGRGYNEQFSAFIDYYKLSEIDKAARAHLLKVMEHRIEIEEYRASLPLAERLRLNHPTTMMRHWRAATAEKSGKPKADRAGLQEYIQELEAAREPVTFAGAREQIIAHLCRLDDAEAIRSEAESIIEEAIRLHDERAALAA
jgi:hypothetical protein